MTAGGGRFSTSSSESSRSHYLEPAEILEDLHLPFDAVGVFFGAEFELSLTAREALPSWGPDDSVGSILTYEPWLAELGRRGGSLSGVILSMRGDVLDDRLLWLVCLKGQKQSRVAIPGFLSRAGVGPGIVNLAAAVCWAGWRPHHKAAQTRRGRRRVTERVGGSAKADAPVREVVIRSSRNVRYDESRRTGLARSPHQRRGHWRRSRVGPHADWHYEWRWIRPTYVGAWIADDPARVYRLPDSLSLPTRPMPLM